jgi:hypothetical protein
MPVPSKDVTFAGVYWQEAERLPKLLRYVRPWFESIVVGVQESEDGTLAIARELADVVVEDVHHGYAEPTFAEVLRAIRTPWTMVVSGDETPSEPLLDSLGDMVTASEQSTNPPIDGFRIKFRSSIDGIDFTGEQDGHVRVFKTRCQWPKTMHSEPRTEKNSVWPVGHIDHDRSLDEMMRDYLSYYERGHGNPGWEKHNRLMMRGACNSIAHYKGWVYVQSFPWWPQVKAFAYDAENEPIPESPYRE